MTRRVTYIRCSTVKERERQSPADKHFPCSGMGCEETLWVSGITQSRLIAYRAGGCETAVICARCRDKVYAAYSAARQVSPDMADVLNGLRGHLFDVNITTVQIPDDNVKFPNGWSSSHAKALAYFRAVLADENRSSTSYGLMYFQNPLIGAFVVVDRDPDNEDHPYDEINVAIGVQNGTEADLTAYTMKDVPAGVASKLLAATSQKGLEAVCLAHGGVREEVSK